MSERVILIGDMETAGPKHSDYLSRLIAAGDGNALAIKCDAGKRNSIYASITDVLNRRGDPRRIASRKLADGEYAFFFRSVTK